MDERPKYRIILSMEVQNFIASLPLKAAKKVIFNLNVVAGGLINKELFKKLTGTDIWEFRTLYLGVSYRLLAFWDTTNGSLIVTTHGFLKKTDKTPIKEIQKAERYRKLYFEQKKQLYYGR